MTSNIQLWLKSASLAYSNRMAYRGEFFISLVSMFILEMGSPIMAVLIYANTPGFQGWSLYQVLLLQGIFVMMRGLSFMSFFGIVWNSNWTLQKGEFDLILLKPRNALWMFICNSYDAEDTAKFVGGLAIVIFSLFHLENITLIGIIAGTLSLIVGLGLFFSIALLFSAFIFKFIQTWRVYELLDILSMLGTYPKSIYPNLTGTIFTIFLPIFAVAVFPAKTILGFFSIDILYSAISIIFLISISLFIWFKTIKNYSSAGG